MGSLNGTYWGKNAFFSGYGDKYKQRVGLGITQVIPMICSLPHCACAGEVGEGDPTPRPRAKLAGTQGSAGGTVGIQPPPWLWCRYSLSHRLLQLVKSQV